MFFFVLFFCVFNSFFLLIKIVVINLGICNDNEGGRGQTSGAKTILKNLPPRILLNPFLFEIPRDRTA